MLVLLHGFMDSWHTWDLVRPALERRRELLVPALPGHVGGPPVGELHSGVLADAVERELDAAGVDTVDLAGNSLGGYVALQLAERGRARSIVAFAPGGGWLDDSWQETLDTQEQLRAGRLASPLRLMVEHPERLPRDAVAHLAAAVAGCTGAEAMTAHAREHGWPLDPARVTCPLRIVWGTEDKLLPWPRAAARYRAWFPHADWIELDGVGHAPQLEVPLEAAQLILGF